MKNESENINEISDSSSFMGYVRFTNYENKNEEYDGKIPWEKHSSGFASKMLNKYGYQGNGLGKFENGIKEPIHINGPSVLDVRETRNDREEKT